uniref:Uncharacterized protein n=1 Tax=Corethron hystrix TaxID=216773 RepID=A0A7S1G1B2_9STRA
MDAQDRFDHLNKAIYVLGRGILAPTESSLLNIADYCISGNVDVDISNENRTDMKASLNDLGICTDSRDTGNSSLYSSQESAVCPQSTTPTHAPLSDDDAVSLDRLDVSDTNFEMLSNACFMLKDRLRLTTIEADTVVDDVNAAHDTVQSVQSKMRKLTQLLKLLWNENFHYQKELMKAKKERSVLAKKLKRLLLIVNEQQNQISNAGIDSSLPKKKKKASGQPLPTVSKVKMERDVRKSVELHEKLLKGIIIQRENGKSQVSVSPMSSTPLSDNNVIDTSVLTESNEEKCDKDQPHSCFSCDKSVKPGNKEANITEVKDPGINAEISVLDTDTSCNSNAPKEVSVTSTANIAESSGKVLVTDDQVGTIFFSNVNDNNNRGSFLQNLRGFKKKVLDNIDNYSSDESMAAKIELGSPEK